LTPENPGLGPALEAPRPLPPHIIPNSALLCLSVDG
jgi:hypothetical protein